MKVGGRLPAFFALCVGLQITSVFAQPAEFTSREICNFLGGFADRANAVLVPSGELLRGGSITADCEEKVLTLGVEVTEYGRNMILRYPPMFDLLAAKYVNKVCSLEGWNKIEEDGWRADMKLSYDGLPILPIFTVGTCDDSGAGGGQQV